MKIYQVLLDKLFKDCKEMEYLSKGHKRCGCYAAPNLCKRQIRLNELSGQVEEDWDSLWFFWKEIEQDYPNEKDTFTWLKENSSKCPSCFDRSCKDCLRYLEHMEEDRIHYEKLGKECTHENEIDKEA